MDLLGERLYRIFDIVSQSPVDFVDFPDNITAPVLGLERFQLYCVPFYNEMAGRLAEKDIPVFVHMDGDLKPLWSAIGGSMVGGLDSFSPSPDNDTSVAEARKMWPDKKLFVNFPSSVHLEGAEKVREEAERILAEDGDSGKLQIQISENVPPNIWQTSYPAIVSAIEAHGKPKIFR